MVVFVAVRIVLEFLLLIDLIYCNLLILLCNDLCFFVILQYSALAYSLIFIACDQVHE